MAKATKRTKTGPQEWPPISDILSAAIRYKTDSGQYPGLTTSKKHAPGFHFDWNMLNYRVHQIMGKEIAQCFTPIIDFKMDKAAKRERELLDDGKIGKLKTEDDKIPEALTDGDPEKPKQQSWSSKRLKDFHAGKIPVITIKSSTKKPKPDKNTKPAAEFSDDDDTKLERAAERRATKIKGLENPRVKKQKTSKTKKHKKSTFEDITKKQVLETIRSYVKEEKKPPTVTPNRIQHGPLNGKFSWQRLNQALIEGKIEGFAQGTTVNQIRDKLGMISPRGRQAKIQTIKIQHAFNSVAAHIARHKRLPSATQNEKVGIGYETKTLALAFQRGLIEGWDTLKQQRPDITGEQPVCFNDFLVAAGFAEYDEDLNLRLSEQPPHPLPLAA